MATPCTHLKREQRTRSDFRKWCSATILPAAADSPNYSCCCAPEKPGRSSSRRNTSVAFSPNRTKPPAISFTISGRQVGVSCIINCPVTGVNPNIFCSLTRVRFGAPAFVSPRLSLRRANREASPGGWGYRDMEVTFRPGPWQPPPLADRVADRSGSKAACASPTDAGLAAPACSGTRHPLQNLGLPACPERSYRNPVGQEYTLCTRTADSA